MSFKTKDGENPFNTAYNDNLKHWPVARTHFSNILYTYPTISWIGFLKIGNFDFKWKSTNNANKRQNLNCELLN